MSDEVHVTYREQLEAYSQRIGEELDHRDLQTARVTELESQLNRYREALEQYADRKRWCCLCQGSGVDHPSHTCALDLWIDDETDEGWELADRTLKEGK